MRAIVITQPGDESVLRIGQVAAPEPAAGEVLIDVHATAVNRADLLQRQGLYPPPRGASEILGLECAGRVARVGEGVRDFHAGDRVMALLPGGGYAEQVVVDAGSVIRIPDTLPYEEAGAMPEVFLTAFLNLFLLGRPPEEGSVLVHGGGSGVGTAATILCREAKLRCFVTAGSWEKCDRSIQLGATAAFNYHEEDFAEAVRRETGGHGVNVILDHVGGSYLSRNVASLAVEGKLVIIGGMGGRKGELDLSLLLSRRLHVMGSTLRSRSKTEKASIVSAFVERFGATLQDGRLRPEIYRVMPLEQAAEAHRMMQRSEHFGKIALRVR
ncbi:MAG: NAD(P)H-quinone oxidoreductase [Thermoanaerobaculia bacterium]